MKKISESFDRQRFPAGATIVFKQSEKGDKFYILKEGTAKVV